MTVYHNLDNKYGKYGYEDSLSMDTGGKPEPIPSAERVKLAIRQLEIGWFEGWRMRLYYFWRRLRKAWWWKPVKFCLVIAFWTAVVSVVAILALAVG